MPKRDLSYRSLTRAAIETLGLDSSTVCPAFSYDDGKEEKVLKTGQDSSAFFIDDQNADWDPLRDGLKIKTIFVLKNCSSLYGGDNQVAYSTSELSVGMFAVASESSDQHLLATFPLIDSNDEQTVSLTGDLGKDFYHGTIDLFFYLVLTKPGEPDPDIQGVNNSLGIKLGRLCSIKVRLNADGSSFPVYEDPDSSKGLWRVERKWDSISMDQFESTFRLIINPSHPDYQFIDRKNKAYCPRLENEIMAEAIADFLLSIKVDPEFLDNPKGQFPDGTVGAVAQFMIENKRIDLNSTKESVLHQVISVFEKGGIDNDD